MASRCPERKRIKKDKIKEERNKNKKKAQEQQKTYAEATKRHEEEKHMGSHPGDPFSYQFRTLPANTYITILTAIAFGHHAENVARGSFNGTFHRILEENKVPKVNIPQSLIEELKLHETSMPGQESGRSPGGTSLKRKKRERKREKNRRNTFSSDDCTDEESDIHTDTSLAEYYSHKMDENPPPSEMETEEDRPKRPRDDTEDNNTPTQKQPNNKGKKKPRPEGIDHVGGGQGRAPSPDNKFALPAPHTDRPSTQPRMGRRLSDSSTGSTPSTTMLEAVARKIKEYGIIIHYPMKWVGMTVRNLIMKTIDGKTIILIKSDSDTPIEARNLIKKAYAYLQDEISKHLELIPLEDKEFEKLNTECIEELQSQASSTIERSTARNSSTNIEI